MDIKTYEELKAINEAMSPEERKAKRKARRDAKKSKPATSMSADDDVYDMDDLDAAPSKSMTQSVERFRTEQVKLQDLQKEFVLTAKDNVAKRESIKKKLVAQSKKAKAAEADFERMVAQEEGEYEDVLLYETLDITKIITEAVNAPVVSKMDKAIKGNDKIMKAFLIASDDIIELLYRDNDFDYEDVLDYLAIKMESMHSRD